MSEQTIPIPGRLKNVAIGGHVAGSEDIDAGGGKTQKQVNDETNDTLALHQSEISGLNSQNYVSVSSYSSLPATGSADTIYRVSSWDGNANSGSGAADVTKYTEYAWNGTAYIVVSVKTQIGEVFDISEYKAVGGTLAKFADLNAALDNGNNVPVGVRKGGMSVKYVQSSDNKYVQYRLMAQNFTNDVTQWQGVDDVPTAGSQNLIESGGVKTYVDEYVSVTPNITTGHTDINIGENSYPIPSIQDVFEEENKVIKWNNNLVCDGSLIKSFSSDKVTSLILLKAGQTIKVKTKGDRNYFFTVIFSAPFGTIIQAGTSVTSLVVCDSQSIKEYTYTAQSDMYVGACCLNDASSEISFEGLEEYSKIEINKKNIEELFSKTGDDIDIAEQREVILVDDNRTWKSNNAQYRSIVLKPISPKINIVASLTRGTYVSFVTELGEHGEPISYADGSTRVHIDAGAVFTTSIPQDTNYIVIMTNEGSYGNCAPNSISFIGSLGAEVSNNPLFGKKIVVDGDSICAGAGYTGGYAKIIAENNNMSVQNLAVGGGTLASGTGKHIICESILNLDNDADYIIIEGGVNDAANGVVLGNFTLGYNNTLDTSRFYGAIEYICKILTSKFAGKKYGFLIPHQMEANMSPDWGNTSLGNGIFYNAILKVCTKWGVPVLDLSKEIPPFNGLAYSGNADLVAVADAYTADTAQTGHGDGWHPNENGYRKYYVPRIEAWLKAL